MFAPFFNRLFFQGGEDEIQLFAFNVGCRSGNDVSGDPFPLQTGRTSAQTPTMAGQTCRFAQISPPASTAMLAEPWGYARKNIAPLVLVEVWAARPLTFHFSATRQHSPAGSLPTFLIVPGSAGVPPSFRIAHCGITEDRPAGKSGCCDEQFHLPTRCRRSQKPRKRGTPNDFGDRRLQAGIRILKSEPPYVVSYK